MPFLELYELRHTLPQHEKPRHEGGVGRALGNRAERLVGNAEQIACDREAHHLLGNQLRLLATLVESPVQARQEVTELDQVEFGDLFRKIVGSLGTTDPFVWLSLFVVCRHGAPRWWVASSRNPITERA